MQIKKQPVQHRYSKVVYDSLTQAARALNISIPTTYNYIKVGKLIPLEPTYRIVGSKERGVRSSYSVLDTETSIIYNSVAEASRSTGISYWTVRSNARFVLSRDQSELNI